MTWNKIFNKGPKLSYINEGRSGYVVYKDNTGELKFYYEFGGGDCVAFINIPSVADWSSRTGRSPEERNSIVTFVAEQATRDQVRNGRYELTDQNIQIFSQ